MVQLRGLARSSFVFILSIVTATASVFANHKNPVSCASFLKRYGGLDLAATGIGLPNIKSPLRNLKPITGEDSGNVYTPRWTIRVYEANGEDHLDFSFMPTGPSNSARKFIPYVQAIARETDEHEEDAPAPPHRLRLNLSRDAEGQYQDWNLLAPILDHLITFSDSEDVFEWIVDDPSMIEAFNELVNQRLDAAFARWSRVRRMECSTPEDEELRSKFKFNPYADSIFPSVPEAEMESVVQLLKQDLAIEENLSLLLQSTDERNGNPKFELIRALASAPSMGMRVVLKASRLKSLDAQSADSSSYEGHPLLIRYAIQFRPLW